VPKFALARPSVAVAAATAMVAATAVALLVSSVSAPPAGAAITPGSTVIASVHDGTNAETSNFSSGSVISADGGSIAFVNSGQLDNLDTDETTNVYVRDLVKRRTVMISRGQFRPPDPSTTTTTTTTTTTEPTFVPPRLNGDKLLSLNGPRLAAQPAPPFETAPDSSSSDPSVSANGRYVAFSTNSNNIVHKDPHDNVFNNDIVLADRDPDGDGVFDENVQGTTVRDYHYVLVDTNGNQDITLRQQPHLSADASRIVWAEEYFGEGTIRESVWAADIVKDPKTGAISEITNVRQVPTESGDFFSHDPENPKISGDGNHVVMIVSIPGCSFDECPDNIATISADLRNPKDITRVDFDGTTPIGNDNLIRERSPAINFDGSVIAIEEEKLVQDGEFPSQLNVPNVFVEHVDYSKPADKRVVRSTVVSRNNAFGTVNGAQPALSADGRYVAFVTDAFAAHDGVDRGKVTFNCLNQEAGLANPDKPLRLNALPPDRSNPDRTFCQIVVRDLTVDQDRLVSEQNFLPGTLVSPSVNRDCSRTLGSDQTCVAQNDSFNPSLSADGSAVGFDSAATDLVPNDTNNRDDVFVRTLQPALQGDTVDFGPVELGQNIVRTATVSEIGNGPLGIQTVTLAGANAADFTIIGQTCAGATLHVTGACGISVQFGPTATGNRDGQLQITVRDGRTFKVELAGSGTAKPVPRGPEFSADPSPMEFGQRLPLSTGPDVTLSVTNTGDQPLTLTAVTPVGPGVPGDYSVPNNACAGVNVPAGGTCKITVRFTPSAPGDRSAVLQITDNAPGGPHLVAVHGQSGTPTLEVNPGITPPARVVTVTGKGFAANHKVNITFQAQVGGTTVTAGPDGTFRASLVIFPKAKPEQRIVVATVDGAPGVTATAPLLIVFPTVHPSDFVVRG
jgi:hypothetical protein